MGFQKPKDSLPQEPSGFTARSSGRASKRARQQGWQTNEEERTQQPEGKQAIDGGRDYDYGARDFGDIPEDTSSARPPAASAKQETSRRGTKSVSKSTPHKKHG